MAVQEKTSQDVLLEQLAQRVGALASEQKAKESSIKELNTQIKLAEADAMMKIASAKESVALETAQLTASLEPLKERQRVCEQLRNEIAVLKQSKQDAVSEIRLARSGEIKAANEAVASAIAKLAKIELAIQQCKEKVAGL